MLCVTCPPPLTQLRISYNVRGFGMEARDKLERNIPERNLDRVTETRRFVGLVVHSSRGRLTN